MTTPQPGWPGPPAPDPTLGSTGYGPHGYPPSGYQPPGPPPPPRRSRRIPLTIAAVALTLVIGTLLIALAATGIRSSRDLVDDAIDDAASWPGVTLRGTMSALGRDAVDVEVTVVKGELTGTLTRPDGSSAEIARDNRGVLLKGNRQWWASSSYTSFVGRLEDTWISDPAEQHLIQQLAALDPADLKSSLRTDTPFMWDREPEPQQIDGRDVLMIEGMGRRVFVNAASPRELVAIDGSTFTAPKPDPLRVSRTDDAAAARVRGVAANVRASESPKSLTQKMSERPDIGADVVSERACATGICATVAVSNTGTGRMLGKLEVSANARTVGTTPLDLAPGTSTTIEVSAPADSRTPIYWSFSARETG